MSETNYNESEIIKYLRGEMNTEEQETFEEAISDSPALKREVEFHRKVMKGLELNLRKDTKQYLKRMENKRYNNGVRKRIHPYFKAASVILLLIGGGLFTFLFMFQSPNNTQVANNLFEPYPNHLTNPTRSSVKDTVSNPIDKAMKLYSSEKFGDAIPYFKRAIQTDKASGLVYFYLSNAYLAEEKPAKAIEYFKKIDDSLNSEYEVKRQWYLALSHAWNDQNSKAKALVDSICQETESTYYCERGKKLKSRLNN